MMQDFKFQLAALLKSSEDWLNSYTQLPKAEQQAQEKTYHIFEQIVAALPKHLGGAVEVDNTTVEAANYKQLQKALERFKEICQQEFSKVLA